PTASRAGGHRGLPARDAVGALVGGGGRCHDVGGRDRHRPHHRFGRGTDGALRRGPFLSLTMAATCEIPNGTRPRIEVRDLEMVYGARIIQRNLNLAVQAGDIFVIMGPSGSGKSTLLRHMIGLVPPARGDVFYDGASFWTADTNDRQRMLRRVGVLYQDGALWSSMTLAENVRFPLEQFTDLPPATIRGIASLKLALVGLAGFEEFYPSEVSGGMRKRAGLARAMALDPDILFFDEPSSGLDPINSRALDDLIVELRDSLGATVVMVTHALATAAILGGDRFLRRTQTVVAYFDGSLKGLEIGAPVTFNGVKIGSVIDIGVVIDRRDASIRTPVVFNIDFRHFHLAGGGRIKAPGDLPKSELLIEHGLRARLAVQSFVTGQLAVELNFYPKTPVRLTGLTKDYVEAPTIPSQV